jgi:hypothetical protein
MSHAVLATSLAAVALALAARTGTPAAEPAASATSVPPTAVPTSARADDNPAPPTAVPTTALYDAIKAVISMPAAAPGDEDAIRAVVVLTDDRANRCQTRLDELIQMQSSNNEKSILRFGGCEGDPPPKDDDGVTVEKENIIGTGLAIKTGLSSETGDPVQIFFIGIGEDADMAVGRMLAGATGAGFQGVTEEDLAEVLEEFSGYF